MVRNNSFCHTHSRNEPAKKAKKRKEEGLIVGVHSKLFSSAPIEQNSNQQLNLKPESW
jgi:hypothetical protein